MKAYTFLAIIFVTIYATSAYEVSAGMGKHKDHPNKCYLEHLNEAYSVGEHTPAGKCMKLYCHEDSSYVVHSCGVAIAPEGYHNEIDYSKPYPACCYNLVKDQ